MFRWILFGIVAITLISGCGGSGGNDINSNHPADQTVISTVPNVDSNQSIGDITVKVPAGTFTSPTDVTIKRSIPPELPKFDDFKGIDTNCQIQISAPVNSFGKDIEIDLPLERFNLAMSRSTNMTTIYGLFAEDVNGAWDMVSKLPDTAEEYAKRGSNIIVDGAKFIASGGESKLTAVVGKFTIFNQPEATAELKLLYSDPSVATGRDLILVHGWNATAKVFDRLVAKLASLHRYQNIYAMEYDWRELIETSGQFLASNLSRLANQSRRVDIWGHSMGALVCRDAFEACKATKNVSNFVSICGANEGSKFADIEKLMAYLRKDYLNRSNAERSANAFPAFDTASAEELVPGSSFLSKLNHLVSGQLGHVNYMFIAGQDWTDLVVGNASGLAVHENALGLTLGTVVKRVTNCGHSTLLSTDDGVARLLNYTMDVSSNQLGLSFGSGGVFQVDSSDSRWDWDVTLTNTLQSPVTVIDLTIEGFRQSGTWTDKCWYDPNIAGGDLFPTSQSSWNCSFSGYESRTVSLSTWANYGTGDPISSLPVTSRARSEVITVRYQDQFGQEFVVSKTAVLTVPGLIADSPNLRSRGQNTQSSTGRPPKK